MDERNYDRKEGYGRDGGGGGYGREGGYGRDRDGGGRGERDSYDDGSSRGKYRGFERPRPPEDLRFDYKDIGTLRKYLSEHARIVPSRITRLNATQQRDLTRAIKRARHLALLPCSPNHKEYDNHY